MTGEERMSERKSEPKTLAALGKCRADICKKRTKCNVIPEVHTIMRISALKRAYFPPHSTVMFRVLKATQSSRHSHILPNQMCICIFKKGTTESRFSSVMCHNTT